MKKQLITALQVIVVVGFVGLGIANIVKTNHKVKIQDIQLKSKQSDLIQLENKFDLLNRELEQKNLDADKAKQLEQEKIDLQKQLEQAQKDLQAKAEQKRIAQEKLASAASIAPKAYAEGNCEVWKAQAGIASTPSTRALIGGESGCRPNAINPSSGACGIPQALPCSKMPCTLQDPVCQLRWMDNYVKNRYGSWDNAYATWLSRNPHWY